MLERDQATAVQDYGTGPGLRVSGLHQLLPEVPKVRSRHPKVLPLIHQQLQGRLRQEGGGNWRHVHEVNKMKYDGYKNVSDRVKSLVGI